MLCSCLLAVQITSSEPFWNAYPSEWAKQGKWTSDNSLLKANCCDSLPGLNENFIQSSLIYSTNRDNYIQLVSYYTNVKVKYTYNFPQTIHVINKEWVDGFSFRLHISQEGFFIRCQPESLVSTNPSQMTVKWMWSF